MQIPTIDFLKEILHLHIYFMINTIFTWAFLMLCRIVFSS
jgi:hypothetical protein